MKTEEESIRLLLLSSEIAAKRDLAVNGRRASGIETIWKEDEMYYEGVDSVSSKSSAQTKGFSIEGGLMSNSTVAKNGECTAFFNITRPFVDAATARVGDILLADGEWGFDIKPTPIDDMDKIKESVQSVVDGQGNPILKSDGTPHTLGEFAESEKQKDEDQVKKAKKHIEDALVDCHYKAEMRKVIEGSAKIGTGIIRGPVPVRNRTKAFINGALVIDDKIEPASKHIKLTNFFPDPSCGDNIHDGTFCIERDFLTGRKLKELKGLPGYLGSQIDNVIKEGPNKAHLETGDEPKGSDKFEVWYFYGDISSSAMCACNPETQPINDSVSVVVTLVNNTVIKATPNPTKDEFPYDVMPWQERAGSPFGIGVARQGRVAQDMFNASARALMRNQGLSSAPMLAILKGILIPADGNYDLYGGKVWIIDEESGVLKASDAIQAINIPSYQTELTALMVQAQKFMEDSTGVTFLLMGQQGGAPDTVGGMQLLHKNASALLRRIARIFDDRITEPHIRRYYNWILLHGEDDEKGDMQIVAVGSSELVEREIQAQQAVQILNMSLNPVFELSPQKAAEQVLRAWKFEPSRFALDQQEKQAAQQAPPSPQIQAAQIRAKSAEDIAQIRRDSDEHKFIEKTDRDTEYQKALNDRAAEDAVMANKELQLKRDLAMLDYSNKHQISLEKIKAELAKTSMTLQVQERLSNQDNAKQVATPAAEPAGRAKNGKAFEQ